MRFRAGRNNLAATIFVPSDCKNNCEFCTTKCEYRGAVNGTAILERAEEINMSLVDSVVITGGEPGIDCDFLETLIKTLINKDIYINTTLIEETADEFIRIVNLYPGVRGVNISRHPDAVGLAKDERIKEIHKPVRINVVLPINPSTDLICQILDHWQSFKNVDVYFRADFRFVTQETLHSLTEPIILKLLDVGVYSDRHFCDICDTTYFERADRLFALHKGLFNTSIQVQKETIIVNDIIVFPDGNLYYDWDKKCADIERLKADFRIGSPKNTILELINDWSEPMTERLVSEILGLTLDYTKTLCAELEQADEIESITGKGFEFDTIKLLLRKGGYA